MTIRSATVLVLCLALGSVAAPMGAQLKVDGDDRDFSEFACVDTTLGCDFPNPPESNDLSNAGDLFVEYDLEVADRIYVRNIRNRDFNASGTGLRLIDMRSSQSIAFTVDINNNNNLSDKFEWFHNDSVNFTQKLAELQPDGDLLIGGTLSQNQFGITQSFLAGEPLEPGDVVRVDPRRSNQALLSTGVSGVLGVVSRSAAIDMGGALFTAEDLDPWGEDIKRRFLDQEAVLIREMAGRYPEVELWTQRLEELRTVPPRSPQLDGSPNPEENAVNLEVRLREIALGLFAERNLARIALAGRLPVKVDPGSEPIRVGDHLVASETPGKARRATGAGPTLGIALEDHVPGTSTVMMLVRNGWYGGEVTRLAKLERYERLLAEQRAVIEAQRVEIDRLVGPRGSRLAALDR